MWTEVGYLPPKTHSQELTRTESLFICDHSLRDGRSTLALIFCETFFISYGLLWGWVSVLFYLYVRGNTAVHVCHNMQAKCYGWEESFHLLWNDTRLCCFLLLERRWQSVSRIIRGLKIKIHNVACKRQAFRFKPALHVLWGAETSYEIKYPSKNKVTVRKIRIN